MCLAVPGRIVSIREDSAFARRGTIDFGGVSREINLSLVPAARTGDYVLVHVGVALHTLDERSARRVLDDLRRIGELAEPPEPDP
jgi:hydrogenase expression/formation protein HypC